MRPHCPKQWSYGRQGWNCSPHKGSSGGSVVLGQRRVGNRSIAFPKNQGPSIVRLVPQEQGVVKNRGTSHAQLDRPAPLRRVGLEQCGKNSRRSSVVDAQGSAPAGSTCGMIVEKADKTQARTPVVGKYPRSTLVPLTGSVRLSVDDAQIRQNRRRSTPKR